MDCPNCGISLRDGAVFCSNCGQRLSGGDPTVSSPYAATAAGRPGPAPEGGAPGAPWQSGGPTGGPGGAPWQSAPGRASGGGFNRPPYGGLGGARPAAAVDFGPLFARLARLLRGDSSVFRELRDDPAALIPSLVIVAVSIVLMALGAWLWELLNLRVLDAGRLFVRSVVVGSVIGFAMWVAWIWLSSVILSQVYRRRADFVTILRPLGVAALPLALGFVMLLDPLRLAFGVGCVAAAAMLSQVALQEATDASPGQVFLANLAGLVVWCVVLAFFGQGSADFAPGIWVFN